MESRWMDRGHSIGIALFDQSNFPRPIPFLQSLFATNGVFNIIELLEINQAIDVVFLCETLRGFGLVFERASDQIIGDADVERAAQAAGEDVNVKMALATHRARL